MAEVGEHSGETRDRFEKIFDTIGTAMKTAAKEENHLFAADEAKRFGLVSTAVARTGGGLANRRGWFHSLVPMALLRSVTAILNSKRYEHTLLGTP